MKFYNKKIIASIVLFNLSIVGTSLSSHASSYELPAEVNSNIQDKSTSYKLVGLKIEQTIYAR